MVVVEVVVNVVAEVAGAREAWGSVMDQLHEAKLLSLVVKVSRVFGRAPHGLHPPNAKTARGGHGLSVRRP